MRFFYLFNLTAAIFSLFLAATLQAQESPSYWQQLGQAGVAKAQAARKQRALVPTKARNLILFVGDGMGVSTVVAARIFDGQRRHQTGEENLLAFERFPYTAVAKVYNTDQQTPDSAGTMTAIMTGVKTRAGVLSIDSRSARGNCASSKDKWLPTLIEQAEQRGAATGIVSTARVTHATPAAAYAHAPERDWESDADMPEEALQAGCKDIATQFIHFAHGDGIEVLLGGGRDRFLPKRVSDPEYRKKRGKRKDKRNLIKEWLGDDDASHYVWNIHQFKAISPLKTQRLLGLFEPSHMQFEADRAKDAAGEPSLAEMTKKAIRILSRRNNYVLIVEAGRIDHGHHVGNAYRALSDTVALSRAVEVAVGETKATDTLIVVTADHSHPLTISGYSVRGNPILGKARGLDGEQPAQALSLDGQSRPYTTLTYANGPGWQGASGEQPIGAKQFSHLPERFGDAPPARVDLTNIDTTATDYMQESHIPLTFSTHSGEDVLVYAQGPGADLFHGVIEQSQIYWLMRASLGIFSEEPTSGKLSSFNRVADGKANRQGR